MKPHVWKLKGPVSYKAQHKFLSKCENCRIQVTHAKDDSPDERIRRLLENRKNRTDGYAITELVLSDDCEEVQRMIIIREVHRS